MDDDVGMAVAEIERTGTDAPGEVLDIGAHRLLWALFGVVSVAWLAVMVGRPAPSFHHAQNLAVWTRASEALRADPFGSKLGATWLDGTTYTNHPPLIILETALAEALFGVRLAVQRMPAWLGMVVAVVLMERVMRRQGLSPLARAAGCAVGFGTSMVFFFGWMLDTPVTSVPFGLWCVLAWQRQRDGDAARWERPLACCLAVLSGWQAALLAFLTLLPKQGRTRLAVAGLAAGVALMGAWLMWAGGVEELVGMFGQRVGASESEYPMPPLEAFGNQAGWLWNRVGLVAGLVGIAGLVVAVRSARHRTLAVLLLVTVLGYPMVTTHALGHHEFWMFWVCLPVAFGAAVLADRGQIRLGSNTVDLTRIVAVAGAVVPVLTLVTVQV